MIPFPHRRTVTRHDIISDRGARPQANLINHTQTTHPHPPSTVITIPAECFPPPLPVCKPKVKNTPSPRSPCSLKKEFEKERNKQLMIRFAPDFLMFLSPFAFPKGFADLLKFWSS